MLAVLATAAISLALLVAPGYSTGEQHVASFRVNGGRLWILEVPVAFSILAALGGRARFLAGALMLLFSLAAAFSFGLFYLPIAVALLWPAKRGSAQ